ncbi:DUF3558 domain-containing protein [Gandjariella thermophila]|uniref:DUF3558 domain-containing protein n=1 Tax=Gandjariella thermophila TaxID=1931992 RepID=A0A4D4JBN3_9PSEU|nr:DUF3558 domain-containing protein [Gandjariella thermophila]GDY34081.1 hypothetical protein GTS_57140 [Gandjariella thermophila]
MSVRHRGLSRIALCVLCVLAVTGCGGSVGGQPNPTMSSSAGAAGAIDAVDPCTLLTPEELRQLDVPTQSDPANASGETGCQWTGKRLFVTLAKAHDRLDYFTKRPGQYVNLAENTVNGRQGVHFQISQSNTECSQVMAVGTGYVVAAVGFFDHSPDPCGKALKIAQMVEPRLPR